MAETIFLIRHGETAQNAAQVVQPPSSALSERGVTQAQLVARRLSSAGVAIVLSSHLARARMTAETLLAETGAPLEIDPDLQERNYGDIRGTPYAELEVDIFGPDYAPPGGETWSVFHDRVDAAWRRATETAARTAGNLAIVTHGLVCRSLAERHLKLAGEDQPAPTRWGNTSVTVIDAAPPWRVRLLNCTAHLDAGTSGNALSGL